MIGTVAILHYTAPPVIGGVESVVGAHARAFAAAGYDVRVLAGRGATPGAGIEFVRIPMADTGHPRIRTMRADLDRGRVPSGFDAAVDEIAVGLARGLEHVEVLIAHNVGTLPLNLALTVALRRIAEVPGAPPVILWHHDIATASPLYRRVLWPGYPWALVRTAWPGVRNVAISRARAAQLVEAIGIPPEDVAVIPNGIDLDRSLALAPATRRLLDRLDFVTAGPILLAPARMAPRKNLELGIGVVAELRTRGLDARLVLTGPLDPHDPQSGEYRRQLADIAVRLGVEAAVHVVAEDLGRPGGRRLVGDLYRVADALFLPSLDEGFGLPILEAGATRLPVICADLPALRELAGAEGTYFDPTGSPRDVADLVLERLAADPGHRFAARVRAGYAWTDIFRTHVLPLVSEVAHGDTVSRHPW